MSAERIPIFERCSQHPLPSWGRAYGKARTHPRNGLLIFDHATVSSSTMSMSSGEDDLGPEIEAMLLAELELEDEPGRLLDWEDVVSSLEL